jgi:hypothetical protein
LTSEEVKIQTKPNVPQLLIQKVVALLVIDSKSTNQQSTQQVQSITTMAAFADCLAVTTSS